MEKNIVLVGMPGAGKSTLGVLLAKLAGMDFVDTDLLIQKKTGRLLQQIIDIDGTDAFLKTEETVVSGIRVHNTVIATGGSVVYSKRAMSALLRDGIAVYLFVDLPDLKKRLSTIKGRGVVIKSGEELSGLYNERIPLYLRYADITLDCTGKSVEECLHELADLLKKNI